MGTLKALVGGNWTPILGGGGVNEVVVSPDMPTDSNVELWYDTDDPGPNLGSVGFIETALYTPSLGSMVVGAGGVNTARYTFIGPTAVGSIGHLNISGQISFGTSGQTFPNVDVISLPTGFQFTSPPAPTIAKNYYPPVGICQVYDDTGSLYTGLVHYRTATGFSPGTVAASGNFATLQFLNSGANTPIPFAASDAIVYMVNTPAVRV